jgi:uncharacterized protein YbgA (DUF1722 family)/uncharacterized protein YbbK (DUF523 family)
MGPKPRELRRPRLGVSSCLLGQKVRYDGGHKRDAFLVDTLGKFVEWAPVCPEVECGLSVPREAMRLVGSAASPRLVTQKTRIDHTPRMTLWAGRRLRQLESEDLCGYVFKSKSPSSGMERVKVYDANGVPSKSGVGIWARAFMEHFPLLPVEEEGRLHDPALRENFIERVFTLWRYRAFRQADGSRRGLVDFHSDHKLLLMAHSPAMLRELGAIVAHAKDYRPKALLAAYEEGLAKTLALRATRAKQVNVMQHMVGYFKDALSADEKQELLEAIENYRHELLPPVVPVTLLAHYVRKYDEPYLKRQVYLSPHPFELQLRNHA